MMNLPQFLKSVDQTTAAMSRENLAEFIHDIARTLPEKEREYFLLRLEIMSEIGTETKAYPKIQEADCKTADHTAANPKETPSGRGTNCSGGRKSLSPCGQKASWRETTANITENAPPISRHWEKQKKPQANGMPSRLPWQSTWKPIPGAAPSAGKWRPSECGIRGKNKFVCMGRGARNSGGYGFNLQRIWNSHVSTCKKAISGMKGGTHNGTRILPQWT